MVTKWTHPYGCFDGNFNMDTMRIYPLIYPLFQEWYTHMKPIWLLYESTHMVFMKVISTWIPCELTHWFTNYSNAVETHMTTKWTHPYGIYDVNCNMDTMRIYPSIFTQYHEWLNSSETHMIRIWTHPYGFMMVISTWIPCKFTHWFTHCSKNGYTHMKPIWYVYEPTHMVL